MLPRLLLRGRNFVSACLIRLDVRFWHIADVPLGLTNVCLEGKNGHDAGVPLCRRMTHSGHLPQSGYQ